jgi:flavin-dependent dehydrogenase
MDVAVVGAGPAGAYCAERLARAGHDVTLYDPSHPREKPCGGGVTPGAFLRHPELGALRSLARAAPRVQLVGPRGGAPLVVELPQPIDVFSRRVLDGALLARALGAGARLRSERVRRARVEPDGVALDADSGVRRHAFVVGADGAASAIRRSLLGERPGRRAGYATAGFHVAGLEQAELHIEFVRDWAGYLWSFPGPEHASIGVAAPAGAENGAALRRRVLDWMERRYPRSLALPRHPYAASIPCPDPRGGHEALGGARFALVGDAANAVDSITGEGIQHALESAALLAESLDRAGPLDAAARYAERWRHGTGRELARASRLAHRYYGPRSVRLALGAARRFAWARRVMADLLAVRQPYSALERRLAREWLGLAHPG